MKEKTYLKWYNKIGYGSGDIAGNVGTNLTQPDSAIRMLQVMYLWLPFIFEILITILLSRMNVEETNEKIKKEKGMTADSKQ